MAIPHVILKRIIKSKIKELDHSAKIRYLEEQLEKMSGYNTGPYGELKKWIYSEIGKSKTNKKTQSRNIYAVKKDGAAQIIMLGRPSVGKSSLIKALTNKQIQVANFAFTTIKPSSAIMDYKGIKIQLVDLPGVIENCIEGKGQGKAILSNLHNADVIAIVFDLTSNINDLQEMLQELNQYIKNKKTLVICTKADLANTKEVFEKIKKLYPTATPVSNTKQINLDEVKEALWDSTNLIRTLTPDKQAVSLPKNATVEDFARKIHKDFVKNFKGAKVTGTSTKFPKQRVALNHKLEDEDIVELL